MLVKNACHNPQCAMSTQKPWFDTRLSIDRILVCVRTDRMQHGWQSKWTGQQKPTLLPLLELAAFLTVPNTGARISTAETVLDILVCSLLPVQPLKPPCTQHATYRECRHRQGVQDTSLDMHRLRRGDKYKCIMHLGCGHKATSKTIIKVK